MNAICCCVKGHQFTSEVIEDSPDINAVVVDDDVCIHCGEEFTIISIEYDDED